MTRTFAWLIVACAALASSAQSRILRVPTDFSSIQAALDSVSAQDTILVGPGLYEEALIVRTVPFTMLGDTTGIMLPVVDASSLPDSVHRGCLTALSGVSVQVASMKFRNREYIGDRTPCGGICADEGTLRFTNCVFDSLRRGISVPLGTRAFIQLISCTFVDDSFYCIYAPTSSVHATFCLFAGAATSQMSCGPGSQLTECDFTRADHSALTANGDGIEVLSCLFRQSLPLYSAAVLLDEFSGTLTGNLFTDLEQGGSSLQIVGNCSRDIIITDNTFVGNRVTFMQTGGGIILSCRGDSAARPIYFSENLMIDCSTRGWAKGIAANSKLTAFDNQFLELDPPTVPTVNTASPDSLLFRNNRFDETEWAFSSTFAHHDARFNYWGDSTGPYHATENPNGQGDEIRGNVLFTPWYPDTNFLDFPELNTPLPQEFSLKIFPNPFNAQTTIQFEVPNAGIYSVALFDITGRQVRELFKGPMIYRETIRFNADNISSGIYFVRAWDVIGRRPLATAKLALLK
jgi:hypothetical protein